MADSRHIAGLAGPTLVAMTTSEALNLDIWAGASPTLVYLNGLMLFVAGVSIVRTHNVWTRRWPVRRADRPTRSSGCCSWWAAS